MKVFRSRPFHWNHFFEGEIKLLDSFFIKKEIETRNPNRHMFDEDFARLFRVRARNRRSADLFEIATNDDDLTHKLLINIRLRHRSRKVDENIHRLVEEIAQTLIWSGKAYYSLYDDLDRDEVHVIPLSSEGIMSLFGTHIQWVPKRTERHWDLEDKEFPREIRILDSTKIMIFGIQNPLKRILSAQNKTLALLDKYRFEPNSFTPPVTHENPRPTNHFDFQAWRETQDQAFYRTTRRTGWSGRRSDSSKRSDFFICHRLIRFRRNQLMLIEEILQQLSSELSRVGKSYKAEFSVEISKSNELPQIEHLNALEKSLENEEVGFSEIMDYCYKR